MKTQELQLGDHVKNKVSGVEGYVTAKTEWLGGKTTVILSKKDDDSSTSLSMDNEAEGEFERLGSIHDLPPEQMKAILPAMATQGGRFDAAGQPIKGKDGVPGGMKGPTPAIGSPGVVNAGVHQVGPDGRTVVANAVGGSTTYVPPTDPLTGAAAGQTQDQTTQEAAKADGSAKGTSADQHVDAADTSNPAHAPSTPNP